LIAYHRPKFKIRPDSAEMKSRRTVNPKRKLRPAPQSPQELEKLETLVANVSYGGNPEHKRNPGDFELSPPTYPRQGKSLCDDAKIFSKAKALALIKEGLMQGILSVQERKGWPQNIWAVAPNGRALEAMLENSATGAYHGYPMPSNDPLIDDIHNRWKPK